MGIGGILLTVLALAACCSTSETRAAGTEMVRPYARIAGAVALVVIALVVLLPRGGT